MITYKLPNISRLAAIVTVMAALLPSLSHGITPSIPQGDLVIELELVCDGLTSPVYATHAGDNSDRLFIVDQVGVIRILDVKLGVCLPGPFLDLTGRIVAVNPFFDERSIRRETLRSHHAGRGCHDHHRARLHEPHLVYAVGRN